MRLSPEQEEIITILIAAAAEEATTEQCARVEQLVKESDEMQSFVLRILNQEAWLSLHSLHSTSRSVQAEFATKIRELLTEAETSTVFHAVADQYASERICDQRAYFGRRRLREKPTAWAWLERVRSIHSLDWIRPMTYAILLLVVGVAIGTWINPANPFRGARAIVADPAPNRGTGERLEGWGAANGEARLVQFTACVWGQEMHPRTGDSVKSGDSLNLIYGLADLELGWSGREKADIRLEGPAGMVLMADGGVNLNHGKLTANIALENGSFAVETPLGRVEVASNAQFGVTVSPKSTEIHVFSGEARIVTSWASDSELSDSLEVRADQSIQLTTTESGAVQIGRGVAAPELFVTQIAMSDDLLEIPADYVMSVKEAAPVCYWRFEKPFNGLVRNEMADRYHGQVRGSAESVEELGNGTIQLGGWLATDTTPFHVVADRPMESIGVQSYSVEAWVKPSHFHLGTVAALLDPNTVEAGVHGMLLELGGPWSIFTGREHPGRVRFLHRNPASNWGGNTCFSNTAYRLRKWQHVVAVKNNADMRLYIDSREVARCEDATLLADGLLLLVGQLDQERHERLFFGQLDEFAYYERALRTEEIQKHYHLVRPVEAAHRGI